MENISPDFIADLVHQKKTYLEISTLLKTMHPDKKGFSERSVRRFCDANGISKQSKIDNDRLDDIVQEVVSKVSTFSYRHLYVETEM